MSTFKGNNVQHLNSSVPNVVLDGDGNTTLKNLTASNINSDSIVVDNDATISGDTTLGTTDSDSLVVNSTATGSNFNAGMTGEVRMYAGAGSVPNGWLYCNGDTIGLNTGTHQGSQYQNLFNLLSTGAYWGNTGNETWGSDTVKLPDFRGAFPLGVGQNQNSVKYTNDTLNAKGTNFTLSSKGGREEHVLSDGEVKHHAHSSKATTGSAAIFNNDDENFKVPLTVGQNGVPVTNGDNEDTSISITTSSPSATATDNSTTGVTADAGTHTHTDSGHSHTTSAFRLTSTTTGTNNWGVGDIQLNRTLSGVGTTTATANIGNNSDYDINISDNGHTHDFDHTHDLSVPLSDINIDLSDVTVDLTQTNHAHNFEVTIGQGAFNSPHENMPPYLAINFIIKY